MADQVSIELDAIRQGVIRYRRLARDAIERGDGASLKPAERMLLHWLEPLSRAIRSTKQSLRTGKSAYRLTIASPVIFALPSRRMAVATMHEAIGLCMMNPPGVKVAKMTYNIGRAIVAEVNYDRLRKGGTDNLRELTKRIKNLNPMKVNWWANKTLSDPVWSRKVRITLGAAMLWLLIGVASADDYDKPFRLAFHHRRKKNRHKHGSTAYIVMDNDVFDIIETGHRSRQGMRPRYLPMVVPPYEWSDKSHGGYIKVRIPLVSRPTKPQQQAMRKADLSRIHECINAVNVVPWQINENVMNVVRAVWNSGGGMVRIPHADNFPLPPQPDDIDDNPESLKQWKRQAVKVYHNNVHLRGLRRGFSQLLMVAESMADYGTFYLPHQMDFRGRIYPVPLFLNHHGDDLCRGLLQFAEPRRIGETGRRWLMIHMANCCGIDKVSFGNRLAWSKDNLATFKGWADDPLENTGWTLAEKPLQALACAFAMQDDDIAARLPVQVDGTFNGLQHYSAMMLDAKGATAVNLLPMPAPTDVYADVATALAPSVDADAQAGDDRAAIVLPLLNRKVVKQTVMTSVYGVTQTGARAQILARLKEVGLEREDAYRVSHYLAAKVLEAVDGVCHGAAGAMDWLKSAAKAIIPLQEPIQWETPLGLPVVQPYLNTKTSVVHTIMQGVATKMPNRRSPIAARRHVSAFAPNYVHSIDATHLLMTARACKRKGIQMAAVHDCYWTHAADMDIMQAVLRRQFVVLHAKPLLHYDLCEQLRRRYPKATIPDPPAIGPMDIRRIEKSPYFFC